MEISIAERHERKRSHHRLRYTELTGACFFPGRRPSSQDPGRLPALFQPETGWAEQNPEIYWGSLCSACRRLAARDPAVLSTLAGIGVTTQRNTMINLDAQGRPLRDAIVWLDQRKAAPRFVPSGPVRLLLKACRREEWISRIQSEAKCSWIRQHQRDIWENTFKYLQVSGFLNYRLTGEFKDATASQIGHIPFHYKKKRWAKKFEIPAFLFPVEPEKRVTLVTPGDILGTVCRKAAAETGLEAGTPVVACGSDKGCETLGAGVTDRETASLSFGTTATVQVTSEKYFEPIRFMPPYPAVVPGCFNPEVEIFRGFWMVQWFKEQFAHKEVLAAEKKGVAAEELLNRHLLQTPPGAMGLVVQPYWSPGLYNPAARGAMIGFGDMHTKSHIFRSIIEGLGFALREGLHKIEKRGGIRVTAAAVSGGASQSDEICQITADIFNRPVFKGSTHETSGLGAAVVTAAGLGIHPSVRAAVKKMVGCDTVFRPDSKSRDIYENLYQRVYRKMYKLLEPLYTEMRDITGYPEHYR